MKSPKAWAMKELATEKAFVAYRLPGSTSNVLLTGKLRQSSAIEIPDQNGFIIAPFNIGEDFPVLFLEPQQAIVVDKDVKLFPHDLFFRLKTGPQACTFTQLSKSEYLDRVCRLTSMLAAGVTDKVVFSRTIATERLPNEKLLPLYLMLCEKYPSAFVYFAYLPPYGTWTGATPEQLISCNNGKCTAISLAGTRKAGSKDLWGKKELNEQEIVTRYMAGILAANKIPDFKITGPFTSNAGEVEHLCTRFDFEINNKSLLWGIIRQLHPTPAVCGTPTGKAREIIRRFEGYSREYYTGFLGPVDRDHKTNLFVNLRCMKINAQSMILFAGGGITNNSVPEKEWEETELKARTLLSVIEKLRNLAY